MVHNVDANLTYVNVKCENEIMPLFARQNELKCRIQNAEITFEPVLAVSHIFLMKRCH